MRTKLRPRDIYPDLTAQAVRDWLTSGSSRGFRAVAFRVPNQGEYYLASDIEVSGSAVSAGHRMCAYSMHGGWSCPTPRIILEIK